MSKIAEDPNGGPVAIARGDEEAIPDFLQRAIPALMALGHPQDEAISLAYYMCDDDEEKGGPGSGPHAADREAKPQKPTPQRTKPSGPLTDDTNDKPLSIGGTSPSPQAEDRTPVKPGDRIDDGKEPRAGQSFAVRPKH